MLIMHDGNTDDGMENVIQYGCDKSHTEQKMICCKIGYHFTIGYVRMYK